MFTSKFMPTVSYQQFIEMVDAVWLRFSTVFVANYQPLSVSIHKRDTDESKSCFSASNIKFKH